MGSREPRSGKPRMKKNVSGSSIEINGRNIFMPISAWAGTDSEYLQEVGALAGLGLIGAHFDDHLPPPPECSRGSRTKAKVDFVVMENFKWARPGALIDGRPRLGGNHADVSDSGGANTVAKLQVQPAGSDDVLLDCGSAPGAAGNAHLLGRDAPEVE